MKSYLILYPAFLMIFLTFFIYIKNRLDANKAYKSGEVEGKYFKTYDGKAPYYLETSRQTLKNQFNLKKVTLLQCPTFSFDNFQLEGFSIEGSLIANSLKSIETGRPSAAIIS